MKGSNHYLLLYATRRAHGEDVYANHQSEMTAITCPEACGLCRGAYDCHLKLYFVLQPSIELLEP